MGKSTKPSAGRLRQILERQSPRRWGPAYVPAILATREEAPGRSVPSQLYSARFGRVFHVLSLVELAVLLVILYYPGLIECQEQWMLPFNPEPHPLSGRPEADGLVLPFLPGTIEVAGGLGYLKYHPTVVSSDGVLRPFPWINDFLLFLKDARGPFCRNLTVKALSSDFEQRFGHRARKTHSPPDERVVARHASESLLFADAGIATIPVVAADLNTHVTSNLRQLALWQTRKISTPPEQREDIVELFNERVSCGDRPIDLFFDLRIQRGIALEEAKAIFYQAVWNRQLRLDLYEPIEIDQPMNPERIDVVDQYKHWFTRD